MDICYSLNKTIKYAQTLNFYKKININQIYIFETHSFPNEFSQNLKDLTCYDIKIFGIIFAIYFMQIIAINLNLNKE